MATFYEILGVEKTVEPTQLKVAYRRLARRYHPDVNPEDPESHERMARINEAFTTLMDPVSRMEYDATLGAGFFREARPYAPQEETPTPVHVRLSHRLRGHRTPVYGLSFVPDADELLSSSFDNELIWWDLQVPEIRRRHRLEGGVVSTVRACAGDRVLAAGATDALVSVWELRAGAQNVWRDANSQWIACLALTADGGAVALGSARNSVTVTRTADGVPVFTRTRHEQSVTAVAWSNDGRFLATGSADATVKLWHGANGVELHTFPQVRTTVTALAFSPDGKYLAVAAVDLSVRVFDIEGLKLHKVMFGHERPIETMVFHRNGWLLATGSRDGTIGLWNATKGIENVRMNVSDLPIACVAFSDDGHRLAASGMDRTVRVWDLTVGR